MAKGKEGDQSRGKRDTASSFAEHLERERILHEALSAYESAKGADTNTETASDWLCLYLTDANHTLASAIKFLEAFVSVVKGGGTANDHSVNWPTQYAIKHPVAPSTVNYENLVLAIQDILPMLNSIYDYLRQMKMRGDSIPLKYRTRSVVITHANGDVELSRISLLRRWKELSIAINQHFPNYAPFNEHEIANVFCSFFEIQCKEISEVMKSQIMEFLRHNFGTVGSTGLTRLLPDHEAVLVCKTGRDGKGSQLRVPFSDASSIAPRSVIAVEI